MNTLNKKVTSSFFKDADGYEKMVSLWKSIASNKDERSRLTAFDHFLYAVLRGKDWRKGLTPISNPKKIESGATVGNGQAFAYALWMVRRMATSRGVVYQGLFADLLSDSAICNIASMMPVYGSGQNNVLPACAYNEFHAAFVAVEANERTLKEKAIVNA